MRPVWGATQFTELQAEASWTRRHHRRLGEVDVVSETNLASTFQQAKQRGPFVGSGFLALYGARNDNLHSSHGHIARNFSYGQMP